MIRRMTVLAGALAWVACGVGTNGVDGDSSALGLKNADGGPTGSMVQAGSVAITVSLDRAGLPSGLSLNKAEVMIRDVEVKDGASRRVWLPTTLTTPLKVTLPSGTGCFEGARVKPEPKEGWNAGPTGRKVTALLEGTVNGVPFAARTDVYAGLEACGRICVAPGQTTTVDLGLGMAALVKGWSLQGRATTNGVVLIDDGQNRDLADALGDALKKLDRLGGLTCSVKNPTTITDGGRSGDDDGDDDDDDCDDDDRDGGSKSDGGHDDDDDGDDDHGGHHDGGSTKGDDDGNDDHPSDGGTPAPRPDGGSIG